MEQHDTESQDEVQQAATDSREGTVGDLISSAPVSRVASETSLSDETVDVDMEMDVIGVTARPKDSLSYGQVLRPMSEVCPALTDFSNYLNRSADNSDDEQMVDSDGYLHFTETPDTYGWNADWEQCQLSNRADTFTPRTQVGRKAAKVSLLQRVLSVGRATAGARRAGFAG